MTFQKGRSGNPNGRPPTQATRYKREIGEAYKIMGGALEDASEALVDKARGIRLLQIVDVGGTFRALPLDVARRVVNEPALIEASLASGQARVYAYPPDLDAIKVLLDRMMGRVPTIVEIDLRERLDRTQADHTLLARVIREHIPSDHLGPIVAEVERIARRRAKDEAAV